MRVVADQWGALGVIIAAAVTGGTYGLMALSVPPVWAVAVAGLVVAGVLVVARHRLLPAARVGLDRMATAVDSMAAPLDGDGEPHG
jgi:hypothetical protein